MKTQEPKFYAMTYWDKIPWVWSRKNKWMAINIAYPKPLTYKGAILKCKEAKRTDPNITSWKALSAYDWTW
jgi:hypothetical protein